MHIATLHFRYTPEGPRDPDVHGPGFLLGALRANGQILGKEFPTAEVDGGLHVTVMLPASDALDHRHDSVYVTRWYGDLATYGLLAPRVEIVGRDPETEEPCPCVDRSAIVLYTTFVDIASPLRCWDCFREVPLYTVPPMASGDFYDVLAWESDYKACDTLQMNSTTGERFALRQMGHPESSLSRHGRAICAAIEQSTGTPVYYKLHRCYGRTAEAERRRRCPSCDEEWALPAPAHRQFDFRCERCRLLSNQAPSVR